MSSESFRQQMDYSSLLLFSPQRLYARGLTLIGVLLTLAGREGQWTMTQKRRMRTCSVTKPDIYIVLQIPAKYYCIFAPFHLSVLPFLGQISQSRREDKFTGIKAASWE
jgi:hypothetical protein